MADSAGTAAERALWFADAGRTLDAAEVIAGILRDDSFWGPRARWHVGVRLSSTIRSFGAHPFSGRVADAQAMDAIDGSIWARTLVAMDLPFQTIVHRLMDDLGLAYTDAAAAAIEEAQLRNALSSGRVSAQVAVPHSLDLTAANDLPAFNRDEISLVPETTVDVARLHEDMSLAR